MYCRKCGNQLHTEDQFCMNCGEKVEDAGSLRMQPPAEIQPQSQTTEDSYLSYLPQTRKKMRLGFRIGLVVGVLLIGISVALFFTGVVYFTSEFPFVAVHQDGDLPRNPSQAEAYYKKHMALLQKALDSEDLERIASEYLKIQPLLTAVRKKNRDAADVNAAGLFRISGVYQAQLDALVEKNAGDFLFFLALKDRSGEAEIWRFVTPELLTTEDWENYLAEQPGGGDVVALLKEAVRYSERNYSGEHTASLLRGIADVYGAQGAPVVEGISGSTAALYVTDYFKTRLEKLERAALEGDGETLVAAYADVTLFHNEIEAKYRNSSGNLKLLAEVAREEYLAVFDKVLEHADAIVGALRVVLENGSAEDKKKIAEMFSPDLISGPGGLDLARIVANIYMESGRFEDVGALMRRIVSEYQREGIETASSIYRSALEKLPPGETFGNWAYVDKDREFDRIEIQNDGFIKVGLTSGSKMLWGVFDGDGRQVFSPRFERIEPFRDAKAAAVKGEKWGFVSAGGNEITRFDYDDVLEISDSRGRYRGFFDQTAGVKRGGKWGFLGENGSPIGEGIVYSDILRFREGFAAVSKNGVNYGLLSKNGSYRLVPGQVLFRHGITLEGVRSPSSGMAYVTWDDGSRKFGYYDLDREKIYEIDHDLRAISLGDFSEGRLAFLQRKASGAEFWGFMSFPNDVWIAPKYRYAEPFSDGISIVYGEGGGESGYGVLDSTGVERISCSHDYIERKGTAELALYKGGKCGLASFGGAKLTSFSYDDIGYFYDDFAYFSQNGKYGVLNRKGEVVTEAVFDEIGNFHDGIAPARFGQKWGYIDPHGLFTVEPVFDHVTETVGAIGAVRRDGKYRLIRITKE